MKEYRGFVTVATGERFIKMANNLLLSYRKFSDNKYPFCLITDCEGAKWGGEFDNIVIMESPHYSYLDKLLVPNITPYDETIFIDADCSIVNNVSFLFDLFNENNSDVSCLGRKKLINEENHPYMFGEKAVERFALTYFISFNGGVYYFRQSPMLRHFMDRLIKEWFPAYEELELITFRNGLKGDEPLIGLGMAVMNMSPLNIDFDVMYMLHHKEDFQSLHWNQKRRVCSFYTYDHWVSPRILHWHSSHVDSLKYDYYNYVLLKSDNLLTRLKNLCIVLVVRVNKNTSKLLRKTSRRIKKALGVKG